MDEEGLAEKFDVRVLVLVRSCIAFKELRIVSLIDDEHICMSLKLKINSHHVRIFYSHRKSHKCIL